MIKQVAVVTAAAAVLAVGVGAEQASASSGHSASSKTVHFTAKRETMQHVDAAPAGPSTGDSTYIGGKIVNGNASGDTTAQCVQVTTEGGGIAQCQVAFLLKHGTVETLGTSRGNSPTVKLAVVGGTGRFSRAAGSGTLTPTASGSKVVLHMHLR